MRGQLSSLLALAMVFPPHLTLASVAPDRTSAISVAPFPIEFEANLGQFDSTVRYLARARGYQMYLTDEGPVFAFGGAKTPVGTLRSTVQLRFGGGNSSPDLVAQDASEHKSNYLIGDEPSDFRTDIPNYARVLYRQVYPGIDVAFYSNNGSVEYDLLLQPGADAEQIELNYEGARKLEISKSGDLLIHTPAGVLTQHRPYVYQEHGGNREAIQTSYRLLAGGKVRLQMARYDTSRALTIDPVLSYSTYMGGSGQDDLRAIAVDASGNTYVTGRATSTNWPVIGAYQSTLAGTSDIVVAKLNPQGTALVYSTYIGGRRTDSYGSAIAVDAEGSAYIAGGTLSNTYPTTRGAYSAAISGGGQILTKLNPAGNGLAYSTYMKVALANIAGIRVDSNGNAIVAGATATSFTTTAGTVQPTNPAIGNSHGFIFKFNSTGTGLVFSTYLGGATQDSILGLALDQSGNIFVAGNTTSDNFPLTAGALQTARKGKNDAFVSKISSAGTTLLYSSFIGGAEDDYASAIAVDSTGRMFLTGRTFSTDFPVLEGLTKPSPNTGNDVAFITVMNADGRSLAMSTYFGGQGCFNAPSCVTSNVTDGGTAIAVDPSGTNIFVAGYLGSWIVAGLVDSIQSNRQGFQDPFVAQIVADPFTGRIFNVRYATRLGGTSPYGYEEVAGLAIDSAGNAYIVGGTDAADFPTTKGALTVAMPGGSSGFVAKISTLNAPVTLDGSCGASPAAATQLKVSTALNAVGSMTFMDGTTTLGTAPIVNGMATWSGPVAAGVHKFMATRASDGLNSRPLFCSINQ